MQDDLYTYGRFPTVSKRKGVDSLSWRVQILPFLDDLHAREVFHKFRLNEPWNSEHNRSLIHQIPGTFAAASRTLADDGRTRIVFPQHIDAAHLGRGHRAGGDTQDKLSNTVLAVVVDDEHATIWTQPDEYQFDMTRPRRGWGQGVNNVPLAMMADGAIARLGPTASDATIRKVFTGSELPLAFRDDFSGDQINPAWKIETSIEDAEVYRGPEGVLALSIPNPPSDFQDVRLNLVDPIPPTDFEVSVDFRVPKGRAMAWLIVEDQGNSGHVYGAYFGGKTVSYRAWCRNDQQAGTVGPPFRRFGDEHAQWHNLMLRFDADQGLIHTLVDGQTASPSVEFKPERILVGLQIKHSVKAGSGPAQVEFDNFRRRCPSNDTVLRNERSDAPTNVGRLESER